MAARGWGVPRHGPRRVSSGLTPSPSAWRRGSPSSPGCSSACSPRNRRYICRRGFIYMESDAYKFSSCYGSPPLFPWGEGKAAKGRLRSIRARPVVPTTLRAKRPRVPSARAPRSLREALRVPRQHVPPVETVTRQSMGRFARGPKYSRN